MNYDVYEIGKVYSNLEYTVLNPFFFLVDFGIYLLQIHIYC
jgi:hypothetical protein